MARKRQGAAGYEVRTLPEHARVPLCSRRTNRGLFASPACRSLMTS